MLEYICRDRISKKEKRIEALSRQEAAKKFVAEFPTVKETDVIVMLSGKGMVRPASPGILGG